MSGFRYIRITVDATRYTSLVQFSEFRLLDASSNVMSWSGATATSAQSFSGEGPGNILDGSTSTKYCANYPSGKTVTIDLGSGRTLDTATYKTYQWYTANDEPGRDPKSWTIDLSEDGTNWITVDKVVDASITTTRYALAYTGSFTFPAKYLLESGGDYYAMVNDVLTNVGSTLNAQLFADYGMNTVPDWEDYSSLTAPSILCWSDSTSVAMTATTTGLPSPQTVYYDSIDLTSPDIAGIDSVEVDCEGSPVIAVSVDNSTWKIWDENDEQWETLTSSVGGMTPTVVEGISSSDWSDLIDGYTNLYVRWTLAAAADSMKEIIVNFTSN